MIDFYQNLPLHLDPIAFSIGSFSLRWYALSYLVGFLAAYLLLIYRIKLKECPKLAVESGLDAKNEVATNNLQDLILDYLLLVFFSALIGGRLGYVLLYNFTYYLANPMAIFSPYDLSSGQYIGIFGMSYHGALVAVIISSWIFLKKKRIDFFAWADFVVPAAALGYFFGRVGNFLNGELFGRVTSSSLGMHFTADAANLRHPSQLYEALLEGIVLFVVLWKMRKHKFGAGFLFGTYLLGYGLLRMVAEQFREPDTQLGFLWNYFTMGQLLSGVMVVSGLVLIILKKRK